MAGLPAGAAAFGGGGGAAAAGVGVGRAAGLDRCSVEPRTWGPDAGRGACACSIIYCPQHGDSVTREEAALSTVGGKRPANSCQQSDLATQCCIPHLHRLQLSALKVILCSNALMCSWQKGMMGLHCLARAGGLAIQHVNIKTISAFLKGLRSPLEPSDGMLVRKGLAATKRNMQEATCPGLAVLFRRKDKHCVGRFSRSNKAFASAAFPL